MKQLLNNWTAKLKAIEKGKENTFPSKFYDSILTVRRRLEREEFGTFQTCKERGADTFTVKRTS